MHAFDESATATALFMSKLDVLFVPLHEELAKAGAVVVVGGIGDVDQLLQSLPLHSRLPDTGEQRNLTKKLSKLLILENLRKYYCTKIS